MENEKKPPESEHIITVRMPGIHELNASIEETAQEVNKALLDFVLRVAKDPQARDIELQVMPEVAKVILETVKPRPVNHCRFEKSPRRIILQKRSF